MLASRTEFRKTLEDEINPLPESEIVVEGSCELTVVGCADFSVGTGISPTHFELPPQEITTMPSVVVASSKSHAHTTCLRIR